MSEVVTQYDEWGCLEVSPRKPHGRSKPENRIHAGHVWPMASREAAERLAASREAAHPQNPLKVVRRTVVVGAWREPVDA